MYTTLVVDDNKEAIKLITDHINQIPTLTLVKSTTDPVEALMFLSRQMVDLIFLDVEMPHLTGLEFIENLKEKHGLLIPKIILTTGHETYALKSYDYGVFDYLLKPISFKRFLISVDRFLADSRKTVEGTTSSGGFLFVDIGVKKVKIEFKNILYIEGARNYIYINTIKEKIVVHSSLSSIMESLPEELFLRVHKSFIVNVENIVSIKSNEINCGHNLRPFPIGVTYREMVYQKLQLNK